MDTNTRKKLMEIGDSAFASIKQLVDGLDDRETSRDEILEDALSVQVRTDWHDVGEEADADREYCILLSTGGPATRIVGELSDFGEPTTAVLEVQDWGTPWTAWNSDSDDDGVLLQYASCFYFGEGK